jgi:hypothetical protein
MQIIDLVNQRGAGPVVLSALRKRLNHKKHSVGVLAVVLLEALVKNSPAFVPLVATQEFLDELIHTLPKQVRDPHNKSFFSTLRDQARDILAVERYDKTLLLIESWGKTWSSDSEAVRRDRRLGIFVETYRQLQRAGVHFPAPERDEMAPIVTPQANQKVAQQRAEAQRRQLEELAAAQERERQAQQAAAPAFKFTDGELVSATEMCTVLRDLLTESSPDEDLRRNELVQTIVATLRPMTANIAKRLSAQAHADRPNERLLGELLQANEICVDAAAYYEGLLTGKMKRRVPQQPAPAPAAAASHSRNSSMSSSASAAPAPSSSSHAAAAAAAPLAKPLQPSSVPARKPVAVPLLPPPSESPTRARKPSSAAGSSPMAGSPAVAAAAPIAVASPQANLLDLDLLFSSPAASAAAPAPVAGSGARSAAPSLLDDFFGAQSSPAQAQAQPHQLYQPPAPQPMAQQHEPMETHGETAGGPAPVPVYVQQQALLRRAQEQKQRQQQGLSPLPLSPAASPPAAAFPSAASAAPARPARPSAGLSAFALSPPPSAAGASADFFASGGGRPSAAAQQPPLRMPPAPMAAGAASAAPTPFDSAEDANDPFAALAMRSSPPAKEKKKDDKLADQFAAFQF